MNTYRLDNERGRTLTSGLSLAECGRTIATVAGLCCDAMTDAEAEEYALVHGGDGPLYLIGDDEAERVADTADIDAETMVRVTIAGSCSGTSFALSLGRLFADDDGLAAEASAIRDALADAGVYRTGGGAADRVTIELED